MISDLSIGGDRPSASAAKVVRIISLKGFRKPFIICIRSR